MKLFWLLCVIILPFLGYAQQTDCNCSADYNKMIEKVEANYVAYHLTKKEIGKAYEQRKKQFQQRAEKTPMNKCAELLHEFVSFFKDGHIFVIESPSYSKEQEQQFKNDIKKNSVPLATVNKRLLSKNKKDDIEGLWTDGVSVFAVMKDKAIRAGFSHVAIIIRSAKSDKVGEIKAAFNKPDHEYKGLYYSNTYSPRSVQATLYKNDSLLYMSGGMYWGRVAYTDEKSIEQAVAYDPMLPSLSFSGDKYAILSLPSFLINGNILDSILMKNFAALTTVPYLIVDIRGNIGGNAIFFSLMSAYYDHPAKHEAPGYAIASPDNLKYFDTYAKMSASNPYLPVVKAMQDSMGQMITGPAFNDLVLEAVPSKLKKVVIITDHANASAAETFVLYSKDVSNRVLTMGENTAGIVDYNNVHMIALTCKSQNIYLGYPMYSRNRGVPAKGYNNVGIPPDVVIPKGVKDRISYVINYLEKKF